MTSETTIIASPSPPPSFLREFYRNPESFTNSVRWSIWPESDSGSLPDNDVTDPLIFRRTEDGRVIVETYLSVLRPKDPLLLMDTWEGWTKYLIDVVVEVNGVRKHCTIDAPLALRQGDPLPKVVCDLGKFEPSIPDTYLSALNISFKLVSKPYPPTTPGSPPAPIALSSHPVQTWTLSDNVFMYGTDPRSARSADYRLFHWEPSHKDNPNYLFENQAVLNKDAPAMIVIATHDMPGMRLLPEVITKGKKPKSVFRYSFTSKQEPFVTNIADALPDVANSLTAKIFGPAGFPFVEFVKVDDPTHAHIVFNKVDNPLTGGKARAGGVIDIGPYRDGHSTLTDIIKHELGHQMGLCHQFNGNIRSIMAYKPMIDGIVTDYEAIDVARLYEIHGLSPVSDTTD